MCIERLKACWPITDISTAQKMVLLALADRADDAGVCWPSLRSIGEYTCLSERAIRMALRGLEAAGLIRCGRRLNNSTVYTVFPGRRFHKKAEDELPADEGCAIHGPDLAFSQATENGPTPANDAPPPPRHDVPQVGHQLPTVGHDVPQVGHQLPTNPQRTLKEPSKNPKESDARASPPPCPEGVDAQLWADWLAVRKAKRAPLTATALAGVQREAAKAGITLAEALRCCVEAGWQGFRAEWFARLNAPAAPPRPGHASPAESFRERDLRLGRERYASLTGRPLDAPAAPFIDVEIASPATVPGLPPRPIHSLPNPDSSATERRAT